MEGILVRLKRNYLYPYAIDKTLVDHEFINIICFILLLFESSRNGKRIKRLRKLNNTKTCRTFDEGYGVEVKVGNDGELLSYGNASNVISCNS